MKKKNTLRTRPQDIKYEPIREPKQPLWMHSIERPVRNKHEAWQSFLLLAMFGVFFYILFTYFLK